MDETRILKRSEQKTEDTWRLEDLFATDAAWEAAYAEAEKLPATFAPFAGHLGDSAQRLLAFFQAQDEASQKLELLAQYAYRRSDEDAANSYYTQCKGKALSLSVAMQSAIAFSTPELLAIPEEKLTQFFQTEAKLEIYRRPIEKIRAQRAHVLSDAEERILAAAGEIAAAPEQIGAVLRDADLRFPNVTDDAGKTYPLTQGSFVQLLRSSDRALREKTFTIFYNVFAQFQHTIAAILDGHMKQLSFFATQRHYPDLLTASLAQTEVPTQVYHSLIDTVHKHLPTMYRYMRLRKKMFGVDELHMYDVYLPLVPQSQEKITFAQAKEAVLTALKPLGEDYRAVLEEAFANRWIDIYENEGKRGGAYSAGARPHPYVLLNHKDTLDCQFTLVHEMGHAMHSYLSAKHQPYATSDYVIFVAEVASTVNEVLLMRDLLGKTTDKKERAALINYFLEQFRTTLYRQTMFAEFELAMSHRVEAGESLTSEFLNETYLSLNRTYYGDDMILDPGIALEWSRVPHFFYNFYVFQYATGFSAAVAIANRILRDGKPAVEDYLRFLSGGCSQDPISLLKIAGVDMTTPAPVADALSLFDDLITELEALQA